MRRDVLVAAGTAVALALAGAAWWASLPGSKPLSQANVVFVMGCTLRADQIGPWGGPDTMPRLAKWAAGGVVVDDVITTAPWTKPATTALVTGRDAIDIGMIDPHRGRDQEKLADDVVTLAERMRASGRVTVGGTANPNNHAVFGFDQGFDAYWQPDDLWRQSSSKIDGSVVVDAVLDELGKRTAGGRPFYLQLLLIDAHTPYTLGGDVWIPYARDGSTPTVARYHAMLGHLDDNLGRLVDGLAKLGHDERDTLFVVVGDHGEGLFTPRKAGKGHGNYLYPATTHVPWAVWGPDIPRGGHVGGLVSSLDVAPTLLGLLKLPKDSDLSGDDLSSLFLAGHGDSPREAAAVDTWFKKASRAALYTPDEACQHDFAPDATAEMEQHGHPPFRDVCWSWRSDPAARNPYADPMLDGRVVGWRTEHQARYDAWTSTHADAEAHVDAATSRALEALGYVAGDSDSP